MIDTGSTAPTFPGGDLIVRGGQIGITVSAADTVTDDCNVKIFTVRLAKKPDFTKVPSTITYGGMLNGAAEFSEVGKIVDVKEATINYASNQTITVVRRLGVQKIDMENVGTTLGSQYAFIVCATNMIDATANNLQGIVWHDMSFTGDAVTGAV